MENLLIKTNYMDTPKSQVDKLQGDKNRIEKEIEHIQSDCPHPSKSIKQKKSEIRWFCNDCNIALNYANPAEIENFLNPEK